MNETTRVKTPITDNKLKTVKKSDDKGVVSGIGIYMSDPDDPNLMKDQDGEFFTKDTYLGHSYEKTEALFNHAYDLPIYSSQRGVEAFIQGLISHKFKNPVMAKFDEDVGHIVAELMLDLAQNYERWVWDQCEKGALGWSSGAMNRRCRIDCKSGQIIEWPVIEYSLTPVPCDIRNRVSAQKSFLNFLKGTAPPDELEDWGDLSLEKDGSSSKSGKTVITVQKLETDELESNSLQIKSELALINLHNLVQ